MKKTAINKAELINHINWEKEWYELTNDEKANYLSLKNIPLLSNVNESKVRISFNMDKLIVMERGIEKLHLYI